MKRIISFFALSLLLLSFGCTKEGQKKLEVSPTSISIYSEGKASITTNVEDASFSSQDDYYASVTPSGLVTGNKVGTTSIRVTSSYGSSSIPVKVLSQYSLYPDIDGLIGKSLSDITKVMGNNYSTSTSSSGSPMYTFNQPTSYATAIIFTLKNNICESAIVAIPTTHTSMLTKHLIERYTVAGTQNGYYFFLNHGKKVVIGLTVYSSSLLAVAYMENTTLKSSDGIDLSTLDIYNLLNLR